MAEFIGGQCTSIACEAPTIAYQFERARIGEQILNLILAQGGWHCQGAFQRAALDGGVAAGVIGNRGFRGWPDRYNEGLLAARMAAPPFGWWGREGVRGVGYGDGLQKADEKWRPFSSGRRGAGSRSCAGLILLLRVANFEHDGSVGWNFHGQTGVVAQVLALPQIAHGLLAAQHLLIWGQDQFQYLPR